MKKLFLFITILFSLSLNSNVYSGPICCGGPIGTGGIDMSAPGPITIFQLGHNTEILTGDRVLITADETVQFLDPGGASRNVTLPAEVSNTDLVFTIVNNSDGAGEDLVVRNDALVTLFTIGPEQGQRFSCDGTDWETWFDSGVKYDGVAKSTIFPFENNAVTPVLAFGDGDTGFYEAIDDFLYVAIDGDAYWNYTTTLLQSTNNEGAGLKYDGASATNPTLMMRKGDTNTGVGSLGDDVLSLIAGGVEAQRIVEANSIIYNLLGVTQQDSVTDGESNTSTTISSDGAAGDNFLTTCQVGDAVLIWGGTTTADYGIYWIVTVTDDNNLVVDRALSATDSDIDFYVLRGGVLQGPNSLNITGRISNEPVTFTYTVAGDITDPLTTSNLLLDGDNDSANEIIDLQNGTVPGQHILLTAAADIDADDTCTIGMGDTTCTNCCAIVFNKVGENAQLTWTGSTWVVNWVKDDL